MNFLSQFRKGVSKSSNYLSENIISALSKKKIDGTIIQEIEDILISADLGVETSKKLINKLDKFLISFNCLLISSFL